MTKTPIRLEMEALKMATGTLPRASDVMATEDDTVDGSAARKNRPRSTSLGNTCPSKGWAATTTTGNSTKVESCTTRCTRHLPALFHRCSGARVSP